MESAHDERGRGGSRRAGTRGVEKKRYGSSQVGQSDRCRTRDRIYIAGTTPFGKEKIETDSSISFFFYQADEMK